MFYQRRNDRQRKKIGDDPNQFHPTRHEVFVTFIITEKELIPVEIAFLPTWVKYESCIAKIF